MSLDAITLAQPWPRMMLLPEAPKRIENRDWAPPRRLIGKHLALHGGRGPKGKAEQARLRGELDEINLQIWEGEADPEEWEGERVLDWCVSGIYAVARLAGVAQRSDDPWFFGPYGWVLEDFVAIEPVPCKGRQGLWKVEGDLLGAVRERWQAARGKARLAAVSPAPAAPVVVAAQKLADLSDLPPMPDLRSMAVQAAGYGYRHHIRPDPMTSQQQEAFGAFLRSRLPMPQGKKYEGLYTLTEFCARVLNLPDLRHWRSLTVGQAEAAMVAAGCEFGRQGRAA